MVLILLLIFSQLRSLSTEGCLCGVTQASSLSGCDFIDPRIAGGKEAEVHEFPWAALLEIRAGGSALRCGGTLVNDR